MWCRQSSSKGHLPSYLRKLTIRQQSSGRGKQLGVLQVDVRRIDGGQCRQMPPKILQFPRGQTILPKPQGGETINMVMMGLNREVFRAQPPDLPGDGLIMFRQSAFETREQRLFLVGRVSGGRLAEVCERGGHRLTMLAIEMPARPGGRDLPENAQKALYPSMTIAQKLQGFTEVRPRTITDLNRHDASPNPRGTPLRSRDHPRLAWPVDPAGKHIYYMYVMHPRRAKPGGTSATSHRGIRAGGRGAYAHP